jgi:hypothetical protein
MTYLNDLAGVGADRVDVSQVVDAVRAYDRRPDHGWRQRGRQPLYLLAQNAAEAERFRDEHNLPARLLVVVNYPHQVDDRDVLHWVITYAAQYRPDAARLFQALGHRLAVHMQQHEEAPCLCASASAGQAIHLAES